jgi:hydrogenase nickel incorporation protein HypA/HybF
MHELGLCEDILQAVLRRAGGRRVRAARVRVGGHPVDPEIISMNVQIAAAGTVAEGLRVDVVSSPTGMRCRACGRLADPDDAFALIACRHCGGIDVVADGDDHDVVLESITVDAPIGTGTS